MAVGISSLSADSSIILKDGVEGYRDTRAVTISEEHPEDQGERYLAARQSTDRTESFLLRFDLFPLQDHGVDVGAVESATLHLKLASGNANTAQEQGDLLREVAQINLQRLSRPWTTDATWETSDGHTLWELRGARGDADRDSIFLAASDPIEILFNPDSRATQRNITRAPAVNADYVAIDVTPDVVFWLENPGQNHGWIVNETSSNVRPRFHGPDRSDIEHNPYLEIRTRNAN